MTAEEFRQRRLRDQRIDRGLANSGNQFGYNRTHRAVVRDRGRGDVTGDTDVWTPPESGYQLDVEHKPLRRIKL